MSNLLLNMVTNTAQHLEGELNPFSSSDEKILESIYATHVHADESFDVDSLFCIVENIIKRSDQIVDNIFQGTQVHEETIHDKQPKSSFISPLCTLKSIGCELSCKPPGDEIACKSILSILNKLSRYSWDAKAVLTLAAFALEYGDFWQLAQLQQTDQQLAKSLAILKRVPVLLKPADLQKRRQAIFELNDLIKATLQVIEIIFELEKLSTTYDLKDVPELAPVMHHFPVDVFWAIITTVACATKITILTSEEEKPHDLSRYAQKIHFILDNLKKQLKICKNRTEEVETYKRLKRLLNTPIEVLGALKALIFSKDNVQPIIDGPTKKTVAIEVLRRKYVYLFISSLDISDDDIDILKPIYEETKKDDQYSIVWIPVVDQWTDELRNKFNILYVKMLWYVVQYFSPIAGIRYIKEDWHFKGKPIVVVMNPQGKVENPNALPAIGLWGMKAYPFTQTQIEIITKETDWILPVVSKIDPEIATWIKEEKYIFFYGGKDSNWIENFTKKAQALVIDPILKEEKINMELFRVGYSSKGEEDLDMLERFWMGIESLFRTKLHRQHHEVDPVTQEVQKLFSYKNESGWAVLTKGSTVVVAGHGFTIFRVVDELDKWKDQVKEKGFEIAFKEWHSKVVAVARQCIRLDIPSEAGKFQETMKCPECTRVMETFISYKCCHIDGPLKAYH